MRSIIAATAGTLYALMLVPSLPGQQVETKTKQDPPAQASSGLATPILVRLAEEPLDIGGIGHAAPCVADFDGDGLKDLLVGQFEGGKLRIYHNVGTNAEPRFQNFTWFQADGTDGTIPAG